MALRFMKRFLKKRILSSISIFFIMSTCDFSTLDTTLPHNLIKYKLVDSYHYMQYKESLPFGKSFSIKSTNLILTRLWGKVVYNVEK